jgi:ribosomal protein S7
MQMVLLNQNKLMMHWLCGLISADEAELRNLHRQLLADQRKAKAAAEKHARTVSLSEESPRDSMDRPQASESSESTDKTNLFDENKEPSVTERAESMLKNSIELLDELTANSPVPVLEKNVAAIQVQLDQADTAAGELKGELLIEQIGRWKQHLVDAKRLDAVAKEASTHDSAVTNLAKAIDDSSARQETARKTLEQTKRVANASAAHTQVLRRVFNEAATGTIQVDGFGLQSKPAKQLTPGGRALSAIATVVSFDLACVMLSIAGVGNHPRFLIHDSPREGEMEMPLFKRIFDVACYLESCFGDALPSFQYIVTTTKAPPSYCIDGERHTRLILHGRDDDERLLRKTF